MRRYIFLSTGIAALLTGGIFSTIPFIPLGYIFLVAGIMVLAPYVKFFEKIFRWIERYDRSGLLKKLRGKISGFYNWAHE